MPTIRQQIIDLLEERECSALNVSQILRIREKDVYEHLTHIRKSVAAQHGKLIVVPARCLECGFVFGDRRRVTKPGRCPRCKGEHVQDPTYRVE
jgi:hypothetical protein